MPLSTPPPDSAGHQPLEPAGAKRSTATGQERLPADRSPAPGRPDGLPPKARVLVGQATAGHAVAPRNALLPSASMRAAAAPCGAPPSAAGQVAEGCATIARETHRLDAKELQLAGYLLLRAAVKQPVTGLQLETLCRGNETVWETRGVMPLGRSNVEPDVQANDGKTREVPDMIRGYADNAQLLHSLSPETNPPFTPADFAATAIFARTGRCAEYEAVATHLHVPKLLPGEQVHGVSSESANHGWSELHSGTHPDERVVMDAWADGPAILASDGRFSSMSDAKDSTTVYSPENADEVRQAMARRSRILTTRDRASFENRPTGEGHEVNHDEELWQPQPVLGRSLARRASSKLVTPPRTLMGKLQREVQTLVQPQRMERRKQRQEAWAIDVALSLGGSRETAIQDAPAIVAAAKDLARAAKRK